VISKLFILWNIIGIKFCKNNYCIIFLYYTKYYLIHIINRSKYVTLDHKTSQKYGICGNSQQIVYNVWVKIIDFSFMPKIIRILSKDHVP